MYFESFKGALGNGRVIVKWKHFYLLYASASCCSWPSYPISKKSIVLLLLILHLCEQCSPWGLAEETWSIILISAAMQKSSCSWWACTRPSRTHWLLLDFRRLLLELLLAAAYKTQPRRLKNVREQSLSLEERIFHPFLRRWEECLTPRDGWYLCANPYCHSKPAVVMQDTLQAHLLILVFRMAQAVWESGKSFLNVKTDDAQVWPHKSACPSFRQVLVNNPRCFWAPALGLCSLASLGIRALRISTFHKSDSLFSQFACQGTWNGGFVWAMSAAGDWSSAWTVQAENPKEEELPCFFLPQFIPEIFGAVVHTISSAEGLLPSLGCSSPGCVCSCTNELIHGYAVTFPVTPWLCSPAELPSPSLITTQLFLGHRAVLLSLRGGHLITS